MSRPCVNVCIIFLCDISKSTARDFNEKMENKTKTITDVRPFGFIPRVNNRSTETFFKYYLLLLLKTGYQRLKFSKAMPFNYIPCMVIRNEEHDARRIIYRLER